MVAACVVVCVVACIVVGLDVADVAADAERVAEAADVADGIAACISAAGAVWREAPSAEVWVRSPGIANERLAARRRLGDSLHDLLCTASFDAVYPNIQCIN